VFIVNFKYCPNIFVIFWEKKMDLGFRVYILWFSFFFFWDKKLHFAKWQLIHGKFATCLKITWQTVATWSWTRGQLWPSGLWSTWPQSTAWLSDMWPTVGHVSIVHVATVSHVVSNHVADCGHMDNNLHG